MKKLFLIDAYALIFRSYYAFIGRPMRNRDGMNTSAVFGFTKLLGDIIRREQPHYIGVAFDPKGGSFRTKLYPDYKANRDSTPEDIILSTPYIKRILEALRIPILEIQGYEADDVIGTLSCKAAGEGFEVYMVTPDKDFGQLVQPSVYIYKQRKGADGIEVVGMEQIREHYGVDDPKKVIDVLALWGDASDNIPGVPGIGEKSAIKLVCQYGTAEDIIARASEIKGRCGENIAALEDQIRLAKQLATIELNVPIAFEPDKLVMERPDFDALKEVFYELGFTSFLKNMELFGAAPGTSETAMPSSSPAAGSAAQGTLAFGTESVAGSPKPENASGNAGVFAGMGNTAGGSATQGSLFGAAPAQDLQEADDMYDNIDKVPHAYHTVTAPEELRRLADRLSAADNFCFDTETTGFDVFGDRLVGLSFAVKEYEAYYVPCPADREKTLEILAYFKPALENEGISKTAQNAKFDLMVLGQYGIEVKGFLYDTMIIHYLLDPESRHGMDFLAKRYLNYAPVPIETLIGKGAKQITMDLVPVEKAAAYAAEDADVTLRLKNVLWPLLEEQGLAELYSKIEEPLIRVLASMETEGVKIDSASLKNYGQELSVELVGLEDRIREMVGDPGLNVNSAKQLGEALFGRMKIDPKAKMTRTGQYKTDEEYLQSIADRHPVIGLILEYRGLKKLLSTYIDALPQLINPKTGKIHTSFNQAVTATGRLSSNNPNLQNIPIRDERGRMLRRAFIPSEEGCLILSADYSQVELRLMAHLSGDEHMIEAFTENKDIHSATAAKLFGVPETEVTRDQRRQAKTANFGIIYGISAFGLSQRLTIPRGEARQIIEGYFNTYRGVKTYIDRSIREARETGYVSTLFGRKRFLPDIKSSNSVVRGLAERNAVNAPIQGSAADIIKLAMIEVDRRLRENALKSRIILQGHDELVVDLYPEERELVERIVVEGMEQAVALRIPLIAECGIGANWLEAH